MFRRDNTASVLLQSVRNRGDADGSSRLDECGPGDLVDVEAVGESCGSRPLFDLTRQEHFVDALGAPGTLEERDELLDLLQSPSRFVGFPPSTISSAPTRDSVISPSSRA
jgi:hypothetical protein